MQLSSREFIVQGFVRALGVVVYTSAVALLLTRSHELFGNAPSVLAGASFLLLLVLSVAAVGLLLFVTPVLSYIDGKKAEAVMLLISTMVWLAVLTMFVLTLQVVVV